LEFLAIRAASKFGDHALRLAAIFLTGLAETFGHFRAHSFGTLDGDILQTVTHPARAQRAVPWGVNARTGDAQAITIETRAHVQRITARAALLIEIKMIVGDRAGTAVADPAILGAADEGVVIPPTDVGNVPRAAEEIVVIRIRQAVIADRTTEIIDQHEIEPRDADAHRHVHVAVPVMAAIAERLRGQGSPADVIAVLTP
jgi:hypothetical protein